MPVKPTLEALSRNAEPAFPDTRLTDSHPANRSGRLGKPFPGSGRRRQAKVAVRLAAVPVDTTSSPVTRMAVVINSV